MGRVEKGDTVEISKNITRENLVEWFDTDNDISDEALEELNDSIARVVRAIFEANGFGV